MRLWILFLLVVSPLCAGVLLDDEVSVQIQKLTERLNNLEDCIYQRGVAFTAAMASHQYSITLHETLKFDQIVTNQGHGFNGSTGIFRAPYSGLYVFDATIGATGTTDINILKNGAIILRVYGHGDTNWETASGSVTVHLNEGDDVYAVVANYNGHGLVGHGLTTFSGFMVQPDCVTKRTGVPMNP